jgi:hypothetical protein
MLRWTQHVLGWVPIMKRIKKLQLEIRAIRSLTTELEHVRGGIPLPDQKSGSNNPSCSGGSGPTDRH